MATRRAPTRPAPTWIDYMVIGVSPALIIAMLASFAFFLNEVFYGGQFTGRMNFILFMYVMGATLVTRIAVERGSGYAMAYAVPLAVLTWIATLRFVEYGGNLANISGPLNMLILAILWWAAYAITWDCTVIEENSDVDEDGARSDDSAGLLDWAAGDKDQPDIPRDRRTRAHGSSVVIFALFALILFGLGQVISPTGEIESRRHLFRLVCQVVAAALALLVTTNLLCIRRYLRQRGVAMPGDIVTVWLMSGGVMIAGLLLLCLLLPRPSPEYSLSQLDFAGGDDVSTNSWGLGEGKEDDTATNAKVHDTEQDSQQEGSGQPGGQKAGDKSSSAGSKDKGKSGPQGDSSQDKGSQDKGSQDKGSQDKGSQGDSSQDKGSQDKGSQSGESSSNKSEDKQSDGGDVKSPERQQGDSTDPKKTTDGDSNEDQQSRAEQRARESQREQQGNRSGNRSREQERREQGQSSQREDERNQVEREESEREASERKEQEQRSNANSAKSSSNGFGSTVTAILKAFVWVYYALIIALVAYVLYRFHREILAALRKFWQDLVAFWNGLFGRQTEAAPTTAAAPEPAVHQPRFGEFASPFVGEKMRLSVDETVVYTFEALNAWGRDQGVPRGHDVTPHEFALSLSRNYPDIGEAARGLADLYGQLVFANGSLPNDAPIRLRQLWHKMQSAT